MNDRRVLVVHRRRKSSARTLKTIMLVLAALFLVAGIFLSRGFMLPCFLMAGLYFLFGFLSGRDYEYILDGRNLQIDVIYGGTRRVTRQLLNLDDLEIVAPHDSELVAKYRKGGSEGNLPKFDYTSYEDSVPYYTMIIRREGKKIKLLLDLDEDFRNALRRICPGKVKE
ncbi:MAG: hypothetical protein SPE66_07335 [Bilifractor sp.]|nr:hypothetical protein [Bilifractor sp.]